MKDSGSIQRHLLILVIIFCFLPFPQSVQAQEKSEATIHCMTAFENGTINWSTGKIIVKGNATARPEDKEKKFDTVYGEARADANRKIINIFKNIRINNKHIVETYAAGKDIIMAGIEKTARDAIISKQLYASNGSLEITVETSFFGGFLQLILPDDIRQIPEIGPAEPIQTLSVIKTKSIHYTGLIIDARELEFSPILYPVILDEMGNEIYSSAFISREYAVQKGIVKYMCDLDQALKDDRIGNNPLVVKGLRTGDQNQSSAIVINMSDTDQIEKAVERHAFFKECRVIIVLAR